MFTSIWYNALAARCSAACSKSLIPLSLPGGTDFAAAEELGLHAEHALALPGRCAPQTAGALIAQTVLAILEEREEQKERSEP